MIYIHYRFIYDYHNSKHYPSSCLYLKQNFSEVGFPVSGPESEIISIYWAQLSKFKLKAEAESNLRNVVFQIKDRTMDNIQNCDSYINIPSSQTYR
jgi:hypothetical protein